MLPFSLFILLLCYNTCITPASCSNLISITFCVYQNPTDTSVPLAWNEMAWELGIIMFCIQSSSEILNFKASHPHTAKLKLRAVFHGSKWQVLWVYNNKILSNCPKNNTFMTLTHFSVHNSDKVLNCSEYGVLSCMWTMIYMHELYSCHWSKSCFNRRQDCIECPFAILIICSTAVLITKMLIICFLSYGGKHWVTKRFGQNHAFIYSVITPL